MGLINNKLALVSVNGLALIRRQAIIWTSTNPVPWCIYAALGRDELIGLFNTLKPRQHGRHFADGIFKSIFLNENVSIGIKISEVCSQGSNQQYSSIGSDNGLVPSRFGRHFPDDIFKWIVWNENVWISINISLKFVPRGPINNIPTLVEVMAWRRPGDKPLSEPMMVRLPTHLCVTRPQWVILQGCFTGTGTIVRLSWCQWSNPEGYGLMLILTLPQKQDLCG